MIELKKNLASGNELIVHITITPAKGADVSNGYARKPSQQDLEEGRRIVDEAMDSCGFDTKADGWRRP